MTVDCELRTVQEDGWGRDVRWRWVCSCGARGRWQWQSPAASRYRWARHVDEATRRGRAAPATHPPTTEEDP